VQSVSEPYEHDPRLVIPVPLVSSGQAAKKRSPGGKLDASRQPPATDEAAYKRHLETLKHLSQHNLNLQKLRLLRGQPNDGLEG